MIPTEIYEENGKSYNFDDYLFFLGLNKDTFQLTWFDIQDKMNENFNCSHSESFYRLRYKTKLMELKETEELEKDNPILELKKLKVQLSDERVQNNAYIRRLSREDTIKSIALECAEKFNNKILLDYDKKFSSENFSHHKQGILCVSDWHDGIEIDNYWNTFNPDILVDRVNILKNEVIDCIKERNLEKIHFVNLGDMVAGRIHYQIRLESRYDVISQTMHSAEILAEMINEISEYADVEYYDCTDNHSRLEPNKKDALDLESLTRIIPWFLKTRLKNNENVIIHTENEYDDDIISFNVFDFRVGGVHGHKDAPNQAIANINLLTEEHFDLIVSAHLHHFGGDERTETLLVANGSLMGTDRHAKDLRLKSKASQNLIIARDDNILYDIHRIVLN